MKLFFFSLLVSLVNVSAFRSSSGASRVFRSLRSTSYKMVIDHDTIFQQVQNLVDSSHYNVYNDHQHLFDSASSFFTADDAGPVSPYTKVDKTGVIGFLATGIENAIDFSKSTLNKAGIANAYGFSIIIFTIIVKAVTLPLIKTQLESTARMQKLTPMQQKIQQKYADDETTKNQLLSQLFQAAQVNPLAGCLPALVQIPIFISLYRALTNLVAEDKLKEPFLWIPDLEGPIYANGPKGAENWLLSFITGHPTLGFEDSLKFLSLPLILFVSQKISMKVLQPPTDPNKVLSEQEQFSKGLLNNLPFIVAFFSINVPAGLSLYWIVNNVFTTAINLALKSGIADEPFPIEVEQMMQLVDSPGKASVPKAEVAASTLEMNRKAFQESLKSGSSGFAASAPTSSSTMDVVDAEIVENNEEASEVVASDVSNVSNVDEATPKRKKRIKPAQKKGKKKD